MSVLNYGTGKTRRRRVSWLAVVALIIPCVLTLLVFGFTGLAGYALHQLNSPSSGIDVLAWLFILMYLFRFVVVATYASAPVSLALAASSLVLIRNEGGRLRGRTSAIVAILLSLGIMVFVHFAYQSVVQALRQAGTTPVQQTGGTSIQRVQDVKQAELSEMELLLDDCQLYARAHEGRYPTDVESLRSWI